MKDPDMEAGFHIFILIYLLSYLIVFEYHSFL